MKNIILLISVFYSLNSFANIVCSGYYAAGAAHVLKAESSVIGDKEIIKESESTGDEFYTLSINNNTPILQETQSNKQILLISKPMGHNFMQYSTQSLKLYPKGIPGVISRNNQFIIIMCADKKTIN